MAPQLHLGEKVNVQGTGRRWSGMVFSAVVVDTNTDTVKLRFADGGYKRYPRAQLAGLLLQSNDDVFEPYEIFHEMYDPSVEEMDNLSTFREQISAAVRKGDFAEAAKVKDKMSTIVKNTEELADLKQKLVIAVQHDDFVQAQQIKEQLAKFEKGASQEGGTSELSNKEIMNKAFKKALGGGLAGASAMVLQVTTMMWMRTTMNYQYRYGTTTKEAMRVLYKEGGIPRFYKGIGPALLQGPLSRFGDTAANTGVLAFLNANPSTANLPSPVKTIAASAGAATWRIFLMPLDTVKTSMQVNGADGLPKVMAKFKVGGPAVFYHGALAASAATFAGHYPWFLTYNTLSANIPVPEGQLQQLGRNAFMGFCSSFVSDTTSNSLRVIKTYRQTNEVAVTYPQAVKEIIGKDGMGALFGRGLQTRLMANGVQGIMFSVLWKFFEKQINGSPEKVSARA